MVARKLDSFLVFEYLYKQYNFFTSTQVYYMYLSRRDIPFAIEQGNFSRPKVINYLQGIIARND